MRRFAAAPSAVWSDLYYDLALVAAIVVLSGSWALDHSLGFTLWLGLVFGLIWSTWVLPTRQRRTTSSASSWGWPSVLA